MIHVIGIGASGKKGLPAVALEVIKKASLLAGGRRHLEEFPEFKGKKAAIGADLASIADEIRRHMKKGGDCAVLATGDPLLFGIAEFIIRTFGKKAVEVIPNVSIVQEAFSRIKESSNGLKVISAHGGAGDIRRGVERLCADVEANERVAVFTDTENTPSKIAGALKRRGLKGPRVYVCEAVGTDDEKITKGTLESVAATRSFHPLNVMIIIKDKGSASSGGFKKKHHQLFGIPDADIVHSSGMITKEEIRAVTLSKLRVGADSVIWDIGAGCGSVAVEAARIASLGQVYAFEKEINRVRQIERNRKIYGLENLTVVRGPAPESLKDKDIPSPNAVFIGGGGEDIKAILGVVSKKIKKGGRIVVNAVTVETAGRVAAFFRDKGLKAESVLISISKAKPVGSLSLLKANNPVFIITGTAS